MSNSVESISAKYLTAKKLSGGTRKEYKSTITKWTAGGNGVDVDEINRSHIRDFRNCVHDKPAEDGGSNPGRTANKARENLRAIMLWAWVQDYVAKLPRFPSPKPQRDVVGSYYLKSQISTLCILPLTNCRNCAAGSSLSRLVSCCGRDLAPVKPKQDVETGEEKLWVLKDLRKTAPTYYDEHMPESSIEVLGHSVGGVTYRHYAHRGPLAFKAIMTLP